MAASVPAVPRRDTAALGAHEAADRFNQSIALWNPPGQSADMDIYGDKPGIDAKALDVTRNDAYVASGQQLHRNNIVGSLYALNSKPNVSVLMKHRKLYDDDWATEFQEEVEAWWSTWAESPRKDVDASRHNTFTDLVRLAIGTYLPHGEVLATAEWRENAKFFHTCIQMIDPMRLSTPLLQEFDDHVRNGVRRDRYGAPIGYYIRRRHPNDIPSFSSFNGVDDHKYVRVRKSFGRTQVIHLFEQHRIDQSRGVSEMVAALKEMHITKKFREITLQNAVVNAVVAATIESDLPPQSAYEMLGAGASATDDPFVTSSTRYMEALAAYYGGTKNVTQMDGVKIPFLFPGTKLNLRSPGTPGGVGQDFEASLLRYIAANLGVSAEQLSRDYSKTNYSSIRAGLSETIRFMRARKKVVADAFANEVYALWLEEAIQRGLLTTVKNRRDWYVGLNAEAFSRADWMGAERGQIDELKESQAAVLRITHHLSTREREMSRLGMDWRTELKQIQRERAFMSELGLPLATTSNTMNAITGTALPEKDDAVDAEE